MKKDTWSDWTKWKMDILKSTIAFIAASATTVIVLYHFDNLRQRKNYAWQAEHSLKVAAIQDFSRAARLYGLWSYDAAQLKMCGLTHYDSEEIRRWENDGYDNLKVAKLSVQSAFPTINQAVWNNFSSCQSNLRNVYKGVPLVKCKPEEEEKWKPEWNKYKESLFGRALKEYDLASENLISAMFEGLKHRRYESYE